VNKKGEDAEEWLIGMRKYFQMHNFSSSVEAKIVSYHIQGKERKGIYVMGSIEAS